MNKMKNTNFNKPDSITMTSFFSGISFIYSSEFSFTKTTPSHQENYYEQLNQHVTTVFLKIPRKKIIFF